MTDRVVVLLDADEDALVGEALLDCLARVEAVHPLETSAGGGDPRLGVDDDDLCQAVAVPDLEVHRVVGGSDLHRPGAELGVDGGIGNDRDLPAEQRQPHDLADGVAIAVVVGVNGDGGVAQHRLGPRRRHLDAALVVPKRVADVDELAHLVVVLDLDVGDRSVAPRTPVDDPLAPVDEPLLVEGYEDLTDRLRQTVVEREPLPGPVT